MKTIKNKKAKLLISSLSKEQLKTKLQFDGDPTNTCSLLDFLVTNLISRHVDHITFPDAREVINLEIGAEVYLPYGFGTTVKRIA